MIAMQNTCLSIVLVGAGGLRDSTGLFAAMGLGLACLGLTSTGLGGLVVRSWRKLEGKQQLSQPAAAAAIPEDSDAVSDNSLA